MLTVALLISIAGPAAPAPLAVVTAGVITQAGGGSAGFQLPADVPADAPDITDAIGTFNAMVQSFKDKNWPLAFALMATLLFILLKAAGAFMDKTLHVSEETRSKVLPWLSALAGVAYSFAMGHAGSGWGQAFLAGFLLSGGAVALHELAWKRVVMPGYEWALNKWFPDAAAEYAAKKSAKADRSAAVAAKKLLVADAKTEP